MKKKYKIKQQRQQQHQNALFDAQCECTAHTHKMHFISVSTTIKIQYKMKWKQLQSYNFDTTYLVNFWVIAYAYQMAKNGKPYVQSIMKRAKNLTKTNLKITILWKKKRWNNSN